VLSAKQGSDPQQDDPDRKINAAQKECEEYEGYGNRLLDANHGTIGAC
jgi:hypothetical protein